MGASTPDPLPIPTPVRPLRVLYADDMEELRNLIRIVLGRDGHTVEGVSDGQPALDRVLADPTAFDLVISDHHMTNMNGLELVTLLRANRYPGKIIVFSSELNPDVTDAYHHLKVNAVLFKPVLPAELRRVIASL